MTTTDNAPVTAQDFMDAISVDGDDEVSFSATEEAFEDLLSRARQQAFSEGRKAGLKEMDEALESADYAWETKNLKEFGLETAFIEELRKEYSAK